MLAVSEPEHQVSPPSASKSGTARAGAVAAPAGHAGPAGGALQRCSVAGCECGGTCSGHGSDSPPRDLARQGDPGRLARRRGPLPLDATLARAVVARGGSAPKGSHAASSPPAATRSHAASSPPAARERAGVLARSSRGGGSSGGGGGGGGGGGAPVAGAACKVDVRATHIGGILSGLPIWHLLVVTTDGAGTERYYRGGPGGPGGDPTYGSIITNDGLYVAGTVDWSPGAPSTTVMSGPTACGHDACLAAELRRIDATGTAYAPTGPNSNTVASTILTNCHIPRNKPVWVAPGWNSPAL